MLVIILLWSSSWTSGHPCCSPFPPCEQLLTAVGMGAGLSSSSSSLLSVFVLFLVVSLHPLVPVIVMSSSSFLSLLVSVSSHPIVVIAPLPCRHYTLCLHHATCSVPPCEQLLVAVGVWQVGAGGHRCCHCLTVHPCPCPCPIVTNFP
jgi:hypothetical protein